jgi:hypothetical protein
MKEEYTGGILIPLGITSSWLRIPPEKCYSTENYQLVDTHSDRQNKNLQTILRTVTIPGSVASNVLYCDC